MKNQQAGRHYLVKLVLLVMLISLAAVLEYHYQVSEYISTERVEVWLRQAGPWAPLLFIALMAGAVVFSPIPSVPLDVVAGSFFGPLAGTLYAATGALIGAVIAFLLARVFGRALIERFASGHISFCSACSDRLLVKLVFVTRLIPFVSFDVVSYGAGMTGMSLLRFSIATFLGMLPLTFIYVTFGAVLIENAQLAFGLGGVFVALFLLLPVLVEKYDFLALRKFFAHLKDRA